MARMMYDTPHGMHRITVDKVAVKSKDIQRNDDGVGSNEESTTLIMLGRPKRTKSKSSSDDEGLVRRSARGSTQRGGNPPR